MIACMAILPKSSIDRRLLKLASKYASPNEMSEAVLGQLTPAQCGDRVREILDSKTMLDEVQERRLLLIQMAEHLDFLKERREDDSSWSNISRMFKILSDQIERTNVSMDDVSSRLAVDHAAFFVQGYVKALDRALILLAERGIVVNDEDIIEVSESGVREGQRYLESVTVISE